jgi:PAS domain S-box-containing protein
MPPLLATSSTWIGLTALVIGVGYLLIAFFMLKIAKRRPDMRFRALFVMIAALTVVHGFGQFFEAFLNLSTFSPLLVAGASLGLHITTAIIMVATAIAILYLTPYAIQIPSVSDVEAAKLKAFTCLNQQQATEKRFQSVIDSSQDAFVAINDNFQVTYWNPAAVSLFGYSSTESIGRPIGELITPNTGGDSDQPNIEDLLHAAATQRKFNRTETRARHKNGREFPVEIVAAHIGDDYNFSVGFFIHDITERRETRRLQAMQIDVTKAMALAEPANETFRKCLQIIGEGLDLDYAAFWEVAQNGEEVFVSQAWCRADVHLREFADQNQHLTFHMSDALADQVIRRGEIINSSDAISVVHASRKESLSRSQLRGLIAIPIRAGSVALGALEFYNRSGDLADEDTIATLADLGSRLGLYLIRKLAESQVVKSDKKFRELIESIQDAIFILDLNGRILSCNSSATRHTGYSVQELMHGVFTSINCRTDDQLDAEHILAVARKYFRYERECWTLKKDGRRFFAQFTVTPMHDEQGNLSGFAQVLRDISERKEIELRQKNLNVELEALVREKTAALAQSENQLRIIADALPVSIIYWDRAHYLKFTNSTYLKWRGVGFSQLYNRHISEIVGKETYQTIRPMFEAAFSGQTTSYEVEVQFPDKKRSLAVTHIPDTDENCNVRGIISVISDFTGHRTVENLLRKAKDAADAASMAKSAFLANMSHEIRTPLGAILGFSDLLSDPGISSDEQKRYVSAIRRNGDLLSKLINDILDLSKVEASRLDFEKTEVVLSDILADVTSLLNLMAEEKGVGFKIEVDPTSPKSIETDPLRLRQVLINIVGNAIKFTERGTVELKVRPSDPANPSSLLRFEVKDSGIGISREQQVRLFQPFSQADISTKRRFGGTGLGLALSKRLAQQMGGDVFLAESQPGIGSTFVVTIDPGRVKIAPTTSKSSTSVKPAGGSTGTDQRIAGLRILLVEDSPDIQFLVGRFLMNAGAIVETAANGMEAINLAHSNNYDLMLMDLQMPVMDGYETVSKLRQEGYRVPIIALTAHAMLEERQRCLELGFSDHLGKPVDRKLLLDTISQSFQSLH